MQDYTIIDDYQPKNSTFEVVTKTMKKGIGFGTCLALVISYTTWKSIFWAIIHGFLGWAYVIYFIIRY